MRRAVVCGICLLLSLLAISQADLPANRGKLVEYSLNTRLFYAFDLKVAHNEATLSAEKVRPQTPLEDLALYPFLFYRGFLSLDFHCSPANSTDILVEAYVSGVSLDCGVEPFYTTNYCEKQQAHARNAMDNSAWFTMNENGTITSLFFNAADTPVARSFKRQLIGGLSVMLPFDGNATIYETVPPRLATMSRDKTATTRYRVSPFTRHGTTTGSTDGIIIRREKAVAKTDTKAKVRDVWSYMVVGGELDAGSGIRHVPTRLVSLAQSQGSTKKTKKITSSGRVYWLKHTQLSLRRAVPITASISGETCVMPHGLLERPAPLP